jgi:predicted  nucleic acid-binding Zn-ribbon protein
LRLKFIVISLLLLCLLSGSCSQGADFDSSLSSIVKPYRFNFVKWELGAISHEVGQWFSGDNEVSVDQTDTVIEYFSLVEQIKSLESEIAADEASDIAELEAELNRLLEQRTALADKVERIIACQIKEVLAEQGIFHPADKYIRIKVNFPPLNFNLEKLPYLLVISPRDRIDSIREIALKQDLTLEEMESIEEQADGLGVSSLVVGIGGAGATYPTLVTNSASLQFTINAAVEEWLHQYLAFKPLGFLYILDLLGISRNYEIATMNETLAGIVSDEIGAIVYERYYPDYGNSAQQEQESGFDFNREMREIRRAVDEYLARGEIEQAEEFMEQKRQYLVSMGYNIRKLNQAYFAFHGAYADSPTSISPIGVEIRELREQSVSLRDFLNTVAAMTSRQDLAASIE